MSNIYFVYDQNGNITTAQTTYPQVTPPAQLFVADDTTPNASAALAQRHNYVIQNGQIVPATTVTIDRTSVVSGQWTVYTLSFQVSDGTSHQVNLQIGGNTQTILINPTAQVTVHVHESATDQQIPVIASAQGMATQETFIGGNSAGKTLQTYTDASGNLCFAPTQKMSVLEYYGSMLPAAVTTPDLATIDGILAHFTYTKTTAALRLLVKLITNAQAATYTPLVLSDADKADLASITLTSDENNAAEDMVKNVLPNILTTIANAAPAPANGAAQSYDLHYASYVRHIATANQAFGSYVQAVKDIPNLV